MVSEEAQVLGEKAPMLGEKAPMLGEKDWEAELREALGYAVRVRYGRSRTSPIQLRAARPAEVRESSELRKGWVIRLHRVFAGAPPAVRANLVKWIRVGGRAPRAGRELGEWMEEAIAALPERRPRRHHLDARGKYHDLEGIRDELLVTHFAGNFDLFTPIPPVTWGRRGQSQTRGGLHFGSYSPGTGLVRLHSVLDQEAVPRWFVRYVLFHELLHAALTGERDTEGRVHGAEFTRRERAYPEYRRALEWEARHLPKLVRSARGGKPVPGGGVIE